MAVRLLRGEDIEAMVMIAIGAVRIEVRPGFDRALLSEVFDALGGSR
jgi:hypothetical protein